MCNIKSVDGGRGMKIRIEVDPNLEEDEVLIRCRCVTEEVVNVQQAVTDAAAGGQRFLFSVFPCLK